MAVKYRAAEQPNVIGQIPPDDPNLPPEILPPGQNTVPISFAVFETASAPTTKSSTPLGASSPTATTSGQISPTVTPTQSAATSNGGSGLSHGAIAAIVIPIGLLAIIIPILVLWYLDRKNRAAAEKKSSHRSSNDAMLQRHSSILKPPQPKDPEPARPPRTPRRSAVDPPSLDRRNSLGLFNFELSPPSTPGTGWMTPNPRFSIARALQMRRSQPSIIQSQPRSSRAESCRPQTGQSERSGRSQTGTSIYDPPPPYVIDGASPKTRPQFAPLERIGTLHHADRPYGPTMQPAMAPTLPAIATTNGAYDIQQRGYTPRYTPRVSSEILQLPDAYGRVHTRSPSPAPSTDNGSSLRRPFSYTASDRLSYVSGLSDEPEPWRRIRESNGSSIISPIDSDESSTVHPHQVF